MEETPPAANPNGDGPRRRPQRKLSAEDKAALVEVLQRPDVKVGGKIHIPTVQKLTGLSYGCIYNFIRADSYWHAQASEADASKLVPDEGGVVDRPPLPPGVTLTDAQFREYQALIRQNEKFVKCDWEALGMNKEAGERMKHYMTLGMAPTSGILGASTGQLISNLSLLDRIVKADVERVLQDNLPAEFDGNGQPRDKQDVQREWRHTVFSGMKLQLEMFSHLHRVQAMMARVMRDLQAISKPGDNKPKGVFSGMPVAERSGDAGA